MKERGFTLVEMVLVIAIIGILTAIGTYQFSAQQQKAGIDKQTRTLYGDLMETRSKAMFGKRNRLLRLVSSTSYALYSSGVATATPQETKTLKVPVTLNGTADITFDTSGMLLDSTDRTICVMGDNSSPTDSIVVSTTRIQLGKLDQGATSCDPTKIVAK
jgi:prepilin-type N-terminal cleavage/methylation domain-containing protein